MSLILDLHYAVKITQKIPLTCFWAEHSGKSFDESTLWGDCFVIFVVSIYSAHWNCICLLYLYYWKSIQLNILNFPCNTENFCASKSIPLVLSFTVWLYDFGFQQYATRSGGNHSWCKREAKFSQLQCKSSCWISHQHRHNQNSGTGTLIIWRAAWVLIVVVGITCIHVFIYYDFLKIHTKYVLFRIFVEQIWKCLVAKNLQ